MKLTIDDVFMVALRDESARRGITASEPVEDALRQLLERSATFLRAGVELRATGRRAMAVARMVRRAGARIPEADHRVMRPRLKEIS